MEITLSSHENGDIDIRSDLSELEYADDVVVPGEGPIKLLVFSTVCLG